VKPQSSIIAISFLFFLLPSCGKKLDLPPIGFVEEFRLANKKGVEGLLIGAYSLLDGIADGEAAVGFSWGGSGSNWIYGSICGSEAYKGSEPYDQEWINLLETFAATPLNQGVADKWRAVYGGVARANLVLRMMTKADDIPEADKKRIEAEARFLRGFYHFEAIKMWGHVPYVDEKVTYEDGNYFLPNDTLIWGGY
jgi:hypothetical protein